MLKNLIKNKSKLIPIPQDKMLYEAMISILRGDSDNYLNHHQSKLDRLLYRRAGIELHFHTHLDSSTQNSES